MGGCYWSNKLSYYQSQLIDIITPLLLKMVSCMVCLLPIPSILILINFLPPCHSVASPNSWVYSLLFYVPGHVLIFLMMRR